ncbi:MAG TPA: cupin domain-containing protein [Saprospiraceae bacterium]|nr:cupin domain-containing protein [Saprospiraceae bacterium]
MERRKFINQTSLASGALIVAPGLKLKGSENMRNLESVPGYIRRADKTNTRAILSGGALLSFLATSKDTNGLYAMFEARGIPGFEPPPHLHANEDETIYMLEGEFWVKIGDEEFTAKAGDFVFMPRNVRHQFKVLSKTFHCQIGIFPAGLDDYFMQLTAPHDSPDVPPLSTEPPTSEMMEAIMKLNEKFGISS